MWHTGDGWGWWMTFGSIWMVAFWGILIWAVAAFIGRLDRRQDRETRQQPSARDIAARRYASGEISAEDFDEICARLEQDESTRQR